MRRAFVFATTACCAAFSVLSLASASAQAHRSHIHFTESKHWSSGRELLVPMSDALRVANPDLRHANVSYTASFNCYGDDGCPDIGSLPVTLHLHFGESIDWKGKQRPVSNPCDQSFVSIEVLADRVNAIHLFECTDAGTSAPVKTLYEAK